MDDKEKAQLLSDDSVFKLNFLDPEKVRFFRAGDALRMTIDGDRSCLRVVPIRAFPVSARGKYISIRDIKGDELGIIKDPDKLDKDSRRFLEEEIRRRYLTPVIHRVRSLRDKFGIVNWEVETDRGVKKFVTRSIHESLEETDGGLMITDMEGNRYEIRYSELDPDSAGILARKV